MPYRFFQPGTWSSAETLSLDRDEAHHALRVLRLSAGAEVELFNGKGLLGTARVSRTSKTDVHVEVLRVETIANPWKVTLAFSLGKPPSTEFILRRAAELGVRAFQPLRSAHSQPGSFKAERWSKILLEVCKQCQEFHIPELLPEVAIEKWFTSWQPRSVVFCDENDRDTEARFPSDAKELAVLIGPEGGWNAAERALFQSSIAMGLGRNRLRAETAALVALTLAKQKLGEI